MFGFLNTYERALNDFERGRIMEARRKIMAMDKSRKDYPSARRLLQQEIEPARMRLLQRHIQRAAEEEKHHDWSKAMEDYAAAASYALHPASLEKKRKEMELKMRQTRLERLIRARRKDISRLLEASDAFEPPEGVDPKDPILRRKRREYLDLIDQYAEQAYAEARYFLKADLPELAYMEIETYLRLRPDSEKGKSMMHRIKKEIPDGITIPDSKPEKGKVVPPPPPPAEKKVLTRKIQEGTIVTLMQKGDWLEARRLAREARRDGSDFAQRLLDEIEQHLRKEALRHYTHGRVAFRREQLDKAIEHWSLAVQFEPDNSEYSEALRRAQQLKERLEILKEGSKQE